ncbi:MAG TPA: hypothetical protein O0Y14_03420, partial [Methanocorpusculum sp.]|nr:hypothetical protein [Methanocorpusculum sp.]HJK36569.1 hypothetical protein [Methanocorpusculum sp.]
MKNTKIMAILAVFLVAVLCVGAVSAAPADLSFSIENDAGDVMAVFTVGDTIVVNITGNGNADKLNVTYNSETQTNSTAISATGYKFEFTAAEGQTQITFDNYTGAVDGYTVGGRALPWTTSITVNPVPAPVIPQIRVDVAAPGPEIAAGTVSLVYVNDADTILPLGDGITFTTAAGDKLTTANGGQITVLSTTPSGQYQNTTNGYNFSVKTNEPVSGVTLTGANSVIAGDVYSLTITASGDAYVGKEATLYWGDGSTSEEITLSGDEEKTHKYTVAGKRTITVTVGTESFTTAVTVNDGGRKVNASELDSAFVYETVRVVEGDDGTPVKELYFYSSDATPTLITTIKADDAETGTYELLESAVNGHYGAWYTSPDPTSDSYITIWYPEMSLKAELTDSPGDSIDGKTINKNTKVSFFIEAPNVGPAGIAAAKIVFTTPAGGKTTTFGEEDFKSIALSKVQTSARSTTAGNDATAGTWTAQAEFISPAGFEKNAGNLKTNTISFTLKSTTLSIKADKGSVIRSNPFTVTISGDSKTEYTVFIENADPNDVNPFILANQSGWKYNIAYGAVFETDAAGARTVQFNTASDTTDKTYSIRVNGPDGDYGKVDVKVVKGSITISASGDGSYYIGEEIKLTGINTDSDNVFLFVTGPNLDYADGVVLKDLGGDFGEQNPAYTASNPVSVNTDDTWEYKWDTKLISLDAGAYTVYATSRLTNGKSSGAALITEDTNSKYNVYGTLDEDGSYYAVKLSDSEYATVSINLKKPFLSAVPSGTVVAKGDKIYIRGTAEGDPSYLQLYIFGPNFY